MSVSQNFTPIPEKKKLKADINEHVMSELELYLQAAQEDYDWLTLDTVVEQLLEDALKKDRAFRSWLKKHKQQTIQTVKQPAPAADQQDLALPTQQPSSHPQSQPYTTHAHNHQQHSV